MARNYKKTPRVRTPYISRLTAFDVLEIHYDDEHRRYHICGGNYDPEAGKLNYFEIDPSADYVMIGNVRDVLMQWIVKDENGAPVEWTPPKNAGEISGEAVSESCL